MKIAVYAIAKDEARHVERFVDSARDADHTIIADTGSTDSTLAQARHLLTLAHAHSIAVKPFRFDDARNTALALVPMDVDVCISMDLDEVLLEGWREELEKAWFPGCRGAEITFVDTKKTFVTNTRVHSRYGWRWQHPCHEALYHNMDFPDGCITAVAHGMKMQHMPDETKSRGQYLELLAWGQWENPGSTRMLFYYGRELMFQGYHKEAAERFEKYLELEPECPFPEERALAEGFLQKCKDGRD